MVTEVNDLVKVTGFPTAMILFGKGVVDEILRNFYGVYGTVGDHVFVDWVKNCNLVLYIRPCENNVNTYYFKTIPEASKTIRFEKDSLQIGCADGEHIRWALHPVGLLR